MTVATIQVTRTWASAFDAESTVNFTTTKKMNDKEMLEKLFEFETYCSARFDSEARVALAVYDYVKQMKQDTRHEITNRDVKRRLANNEVAILNHSTRELHLITIENLNEIIKEYWFDERPVIERALHELGYDTRNIDFMT